MDFLNDYIRTRAHNLSQKWLLKCAKLWVFAIPEQHYIPPSPQLNGCHFTWDRQVKLACFAYNIPLCMLPQATHPSILCMGMIPNFRLTSCAVHFSRMTSHIVNMWPTYKRGWGMCSKKYLKRQNRVWYNKRHIITERSMVTQET